MHRIPHHYIACNEHYALVPRWLQGRLSDQRQYGIAWKCHPTQDFLDLRSQAIQTINARLADKYSRPGSDPQLSLLPST